MKLVRIAAFLWTALAVCAADVRVFDSIADLAAWEPSPSASNFVVRSYDARRPFGAHRPGHYDANSTAVTNQGCVFVTSTGVGRNIMDDCLGSVMDARWFGAVGDGATDNTAAFRAALAAARVNRAALYIPGATNSYRISSSPSPAISLDQSGMRIYGTAAAGNQAGLPTVLVDTSPNVTLRVGGGTAEIQGVIIEDIVFQAGTSGQGVGIQLAASSAAANLSRVGVRGYATDIQITDSGGHVLDQVSMVGGTTGLYISGPGNNITVTSPLFSGQTLTGLIVTNQPFWAPGSIRIQGGMFTNQVWAVVIDKGGGVTLAGQHWSKVGVGAPRGAIDLRKDSFHCTVEDGVFDAIGTNALSVQGLGHSFARNALRDRLPLGAWFYRLLPVAKNTAIWQAPVNFASGGSGATITATVGSAPGGGLQQANLTLGSGGTLYTSNAWVRVFHATGRGATVRPTIVNGTVTAVTLVTAGTGYTGTAPGVAVVDAGAGYNGDGEATVIDGTRYDRAAGASQPPAPLYLGSGLVFHEADRQIYATREGRDPIPVESRFYRVPTTGAVDAISFWNSNSVAVAGFRVDNTPSLAITLGSVEQARWLDLGRLALAPQATDPSSALADGQLYFNTTAGLKQRLGGAWTSMGGGGGGSGDVVGPASAMPGTIPVFADTTGKLLGAQSVLSITGSVARVSGSLEVGGLITAPDVQAYNVVGDDSLNTDNSILSGDARTSWPVGNGLVRTNVNVAISNPSFDVIKLGVLASSNLTRSVAIPRHDESTKGRLRRIGFGLTAFSTLFASFETISGDGVDAVLIPGFSSWANLGSRVSLGGVEVGRTVKRMTLYNYVGNNYQSPWPMLSEHDGSPGNLSGAGAVHTREYFLNANDAMRPDHYQIHYITERRDLTNFVGTGTQNVEYAAICDVTLTIPPGAPGMSWPLDFAYYFRGFADSYGFLTVYYEYDDDSVSGPPSSVAGNVAVFADATGKRLSDAKVISVTSTNVTVRTNLAVAGSVAVSSNLSAGLNISASSMTLGGSTITSWPSGGGGGTGNVTGPATSVAGRLAMFSDTTGKVIADSGRIGIVGTDIVATSPILITELRTSTAGTVPGFPVHVQDTYNGSYGMRAQNSSDDFAASARFYVHSGTANASSGGLFAYHGAAVSQLYRDTVAIIANGDASEGIILNPTAPGSRIRLVTGITQLSVGNSVDILGDLNVSRVISGDGSGLTNLPIAGVGTNLNVWNLKATNNVAAASMTLGGTTISNWPSGGGSGDVTGPPSSVFRGIPEFADTTGKRLTNSWISSDEASASVVISNTAPVLKLVATNNSSGARLNIVGGGGNILRIQTNGVTVVDIRPDNIRKYLNEVINPSGGISGARFWADDGKWSVPLVRKVRTNEVAVIARSNYIDATLVNLQLARQQATNALANWLSLTPTQKDFAQYRTIEVLAEVVKLMEILMLEKRDDLFELGLDEPFPQPPTPPVPDP